ERPHLCQICPSRAVEIIKLFLHAPHIGFGGLDDSLALPLRLAKNQLCLALCLLADFTAQLLRRDQRIVQRLVALAERPQLLVKATRLRIEVLIDARQAFHLLGNLIPELIDARGIVAAQRAPKVVAPYIQRCKMKRFVDHLALAPKRVVPSRTIVAPSSTAIS